MGGGGAGSHSRARLGSCEACPPVLTETHRLRSPIPEFPVPEALCAPRSLRGPLRAGAGGDCRAGRADLWGQGRGCSARGGTSVCPHSGRTQGPQGGPGQDGAGRAGPARGEQTCSPEQSGPGSFLGGGPSCTSPRPATSQPGRHRPSPSPSPPPPRQPRTGHICWPPARPHGNRGPPAAAAAAWLPSLPALSLSPAPEFEAPPGSPSAEQQPELALPGRALPAPGSGQRAFPARQQLDRGRAGLQPTALRLGLRTVRRGGEEGDGG